jgi:hypothetical protein
MTVEHVAMTVECVCNGSGMPFAMAVECVHEDDRGMPVMTVKRKSNGRQDARAVTVKCRAMTAPCTRS